MNNNRKIALVLAAFVLLVVAIVFMLGIGNDEKEQVQASVFTSRNWKSKYHLDERHPYDLYQLNALLSQHLNAKNEVRNLNTAYDFDTLRKNGKNTYFFIGENIGLQDTEIATIFQDLDSGSVLFLAFDDMIKSSYPFFFTDNSFLYDYGPKITLNTGNKNHQFYHKFQTDTTSHWWKFLDESVLRDSIYEIVSASLGIPNAIQIPKGKGRIILHSTPELFQNYQVLSKSGLTYSQEILKRIPKNKNLYHLEFARLGDDLGQYQDEEEKDIDRSYLQFILNNKSTRAAFFVTILGILLFLIFRTTRVQPIVPVVEKRINMTLAYTETITGIFYSKRNPYGLLSVLRKNFYNNISRYFFIDLNKGEDKDIVRLAEKTNYPVDELRDLIRHFETKEAFSVDENYVAKIAGRQREFYKNTGIISDATIQQIDQKEIVIPRAIWIGALVILSGIALIFTGFYFLSAAYNTGVVALPFGFITMLFGVQLLRVPALDFKKNTITIHFLWRKKRIYDVKMLSKVEVFSNAYELHFKDGKSYKFHFIALGGLASKRLKNYMNKNQNLSI